MDSRSQKRRTRQKRYKQFQLDGTTKRINLNLFNQKVVGQTMESLPEAMGSLGKITENLSITKEKLADTIENLAKAMGNLGKTIDSLPV